MKQFLVLCALMFMPLLVTAQSSTANGVTKTRQVGDDGFIWYKAKKGNLYGAYDIEGKEIIPIKYTEIQYCLSALNARFFQIKNGDFVGAYTREGTLVISPDKHYTSITGWGQREKDIISQDMFCWWVEKNNGHHGFLDARGNEVIAPGDYELICVDSPLDSRTEHTKLYYNAPYLKILKNDKEGIADLNGNIICTPEYESCWLRKKDDGFELVKDINGKIVREKIQYSASSRFDYQPFEGLYYEYTSSSRSSSSSSSGSSSSSSNSSSSSSSSSNSGTQTIIVEQHGPVQVWRPCGGCNGSGRCYTCGGTGRGSMSNGSCLSCGFTGRCSICAGQGGHYETQYR